MILYVEENIPITQQEYELVDYMIGCLGNVRYLQLAGWAFECFTAYRSNHQLPKLEEILLLDFNVCLKNMTALTYLISKAVGVNRLLISINENSAGDHGIYSDRNLSQINVPAIFSDNDYKVQATVALSNNTILRNSVIRFVIIQCFTGTIYQLAHIKFLLAHLRRLRVLEVTPVKDIDEDQSRTYAELISRYPRVSADVTVQVGSERFYLKN